MELAISLEDIVFVTGVAYFLLGVAFVALRVSRP